MDKMGKFMLGLSGLAIVGMGAYKGLVNKEPSKYSLEWIKKLTNKEWGTEREIIRQKFCNSKYDYSARIGFRNLLRLFDKVKSDKDWAGKKPQGPAYHREHGFNLYKP